MAPPSVPRMFEPGAAAAVQHSRRGRPAQTPDLAAFRQQRLRSRRAAWPASRSAPAPPARRGRCRPAPKDRAASSASLGRPKARFEPPPVELQRPTLDDRGLHRVRHLLGRLRTQGLGHGRTLPSLQPSPRPSPGAFSAQVFALSLAGEGRGEGASAPRTGLGPAHRPGPSRTAGCRGSAARRDGRACGRVRRSDAASGRPCRD